MKVALLVVRVVRLPTLIDFWCLLHLRIRSPSYRFLPPRKKPLSGAKKTQSYISCLCWLLSHVFWQLGHVSCQYRPDIASLKAWMIPYDKNSLSATKSENQISDS